MQDDNYYRHNYLLWNPTWSQQTKRFTSEKLSQSLHLRELILRRVYSAEHFACITEIRKT